MDDQIKLIISGLLNNEISSKDINYIHSKLKQKRDESFLTLNINSSISDIKDYISSKTLDDNELKIFTSLAKDFDSFLDTYCDSPYENSKYFINVINAISINTDLSDYEKIFLLLYVSSIFCENGYLYEIYLKHYYSLVNNKSEDDIVKNLINIRISTRIKNKEIENVYLKFNNNINMAKYLLNEKNHDADMPEIIHSLLSSKNDDVIDLILSNPILFSQNIEKIFNVVIKLNKSHFYDNFIKALDRFNKLKAIQ